MGQALGGAGASVVVPRASDLLEAAGDVDCVAAAAVPASEMTLVVVYRLRDSRSPVTFLDHVVRNSDVTYLTLEVRIYAESVVLLDHIGTIGTFRMPRSYDCAIDNASLPAM